MKEAYLLFKGVIYYIEKLQIVLDTLHLRDLIQPELFWTFNYYFHALSLNQTAKRSRERNFVTHIVFFTYT